MKKIINKVLYIVVAMALLVSSCDWDPIMWDDSKVFIAFSSDAITVPEEGDSVAVVVAITALDGAPAVTVSFEFDTVGIEADVAAIEGEQFTLVNAEKSLSFPDGWGYDTIWIKPIDNEIFTGNKFTNITLISNSEDIAFGALSSAVVNLKDNEHPLNLVLGEYIETDYLFDDGGVDASYSVNITPDPDDLSKVFIDNLWGGGEIIAASINLENMTLTIDPEEVIYISGTYGDCKMVLLDDEGEYIDGENIVCTISENGDWITPKWAAVVEAGWFGMYDYAEFVKQ